MTTAIVTTGGPHELVAVRFRPGEAPGLLGVPASELTDGAAPLDALWGPAAAELEERVAAGGLAALDALLTPRIGARWADARVRRAVALLEGGARVAEAAEEVGLGERQLERRFAERVGVGPKRFARIARLQRVLPLLGSADLATVAFRGGFSDPSHVVREVRALCGVTPGDLVSERSNRSGGGED